MFVAGAIVLVVCAFSFLGPAAALENEGESPRQTVLANCRPPSGPAVGLQRAFASASGSGSTTSIATRVPVSAALCSAVVVAEPLRTDDLAALASSPAAPLGMAPVTTAPMDPRADDGRAEEDGSDFFDANPIQVPPEAAADRSITQHVGVIVPEHDIPITTTTTTPTSSTSSTAPPTATTSPEEPAEPPSAVPTTIPDLGQGEPPGPNQGRSAAPLPATGAGGHTIRLALLGLMLVDGGVMAVAASRVKRQGFASNV